MSFAAAGSLSDDEVSRLLNSGETVKTIGLRRAKDGEDAVVTRYLYKVTP